MEHTHTPFTAQLTPKFYAVLATYEMPTAEGVVLFEDQRLEYKGNRAFPGGRAKELAKRWKAQATAKGFTIHNIRFQAV